MRGNATPLLFGSLSLFKTASRVKNLVRGMGDYNEDVFQASVKSHMEDGLMVFTGIVR